MDAGDAGAISFSCARCGTPLKATVDSAGRRGRCRRCGTIHTIPASASPSTPVRKRTLRRRRVRSIWKAAADGFRSSAGDPSALEGESVALVLLSLADLMVTYHLLRSGPGFYESNPIARFVFARWNVAGMAVFKFSLVGFVVVVGDLAERRRPGLGRFVLLTGCAASAAVVGYGLKLALGAYDG